MMHGHEKSDSAIVAVKPANKVALAVEGRTQRSWWSEGRGQDAPSHTRGGSHMRESRTYGSGAARLAAIPAGESPANRGVQSLL